MNEVLSNDLRLQYKFSISRELCVLSKELCQVEKGKNDANRLHSWGKS